MQKFNMKSFVQQSNMDIKQTEKGHITEPANEALGNRNVDINKQNKNNS